MEQEYTDEDYSCAQRIIRCFKKLGYLKGDVMPEESYLELWDTVLKLQDELKEIEHVQI